MSDWDKLPEKPSREYLIQRLKEMEYGDDEERQHNEADMLLLAYIGGDEISKLYLASTRWYS